MSGSDNISVPQDIVRCLLEQCENDTLTLKNCSLVSRDWVSLSQRKLFSRTILRARTSGHDLPTFLDFLCGSPALCLYIKILKLYPGICTPHRILALANLLPNLRALHLHDATIVPCANIYAESALVPMEVEPSARRSLDSLYFTICHLGDMLQGSRPFFQIIGWFSAITELCLSVLWGNLRRMGPYSEGPNLSLPSLFPPDLGARKVKVDRLLFAPGILMDTGFFSLFLACVDQASLSDLTISPFTQYPPHHYQGLINSVAHLKRLMVAVRCCGSAGQPLLLSSCPDLDTIAFGCGSQNTPEPAGLNIFTDYFSRMCATLSTLLVVPPSTTTTRSPPGPSLRPSLSKVTIAIRLGFSLPLDPERAFSPILDVTAWSSLASTLSQFAQLRTVEVIIFLSRNVAFGAPTVSEITINNPNPLDFVQRVFVEPLRRSRATVTLDIFEEIFSSNADSPSSSRYTRGPLLPNGFMGIEKLGGIL